MEYYGTNHIGVYTIYSVYSQLPTDNPQSE